MDWGKFLAGAIAAAAAVGITQLVVGKPGRQLGRQTAYFTVMAICVVIFTFVLVPLMLP
jgi:hypothetical protein